MASPICECDHSARVHSSPTKCGAYGCKCTGYTPKVGGAVNKVNLPVSDGARRAPLPPMEPTTAGFGRPDTVYREVTDRDGNVAQLPVTRHDDMMVAAIKTAASHAISQIQVGNWSRADMAKIAEIGALKGCLQCARMGQNIGNHTDSTHLSPSHVAYIFGVSMADIRDKAYEAIVQGLETGATAEPMAQLVGWRQYDLRWSKGGERTKDGSLILEYPEPRLFLSGAQGNFWTSGKYAAICSTVGAYGDRKWWRQAEEMDYLISTDIHQWDTAAAHLYMEAAKERCREHYQQTVGVTVDRDSLTIRRATDNCTCGAYAVSDRGRVMGRDGNTAGVSAYSGMSYERNETSNVKAVVWGYGLCHVGADGQSWRATNAMIDSLIFYPGVRIEGMAAPTATIHGAWTRYAKSVDYEALAKDLAVYYECPVIFASGTRADHFDTENQTWVYEDKVEAVVQPPSVDLGWLKI